MSPKKKSSKKVSPKKVSPKKKSAKKVSPKKKSSKKVSPKKVSPKKKSAKKVSPKKKSAKKVSPKKVSPKKKMASPKKVSKKVSPKKKSSHRKRISSHYKMRGMGVLLNMYGGATDALEQEIAQRKNELNDLKRQLSQERSEERRAKIRQMMANVQARLDVGKQKLGQLFEGASQAAQRAAQDLRARGVIAGQKLSSGLKSLGMDIQAGVERYRDRRAIERYHAEKAREETSHLRAQQLEAEMQKRLSARSSPPSYRSSPMSTYSGPDHRSPSYRSPVQSSYSSPVRVPQVSPVQSSYSSPVRVPQVSPYASSLQRSSSMSSLGSARPAWR